MTPYSFLIRPIVSYLLLFYHAERALIPTLAKKLYNKSYFFAKLGDKPAAYLAYVRSLSSDGW